MGIDGEWHLEIHRGFHAFDDEVFGCLSLRGGGLEDKFVVDLEEHLGVVQ